MSELPSNPAPVYFNAANLTTATALWTHMARTGEIFSPLPTVVGNIEVTDELKAKIGEYRCSRYWGDHEDMGSVQAVFGDDGYFSHIDLSKLTRPQEHTFQERDDLFPDFVAQFVPEITSFACISDADSRVFLAEDLPPEPHTLDIGVYWSRQEDYMLDIWEPKAHIDGDGDERHGWRLGHTVALGSPTLHYPGLITKVDDRGRYVTKHIPPHVEDPGAVTRLHRTSMHARPIRFDAPRLFLRAFHKRRSFS